MFTGYVKPTNYGKTNHFALSKIVALKKTVLAWLSFNKVRFIKAARSNQSVDNLVAILDNPLTFWWLFGIHN